MPATAAWIGTTIILTPREPNWEPRFKFAESEAAITIICRMPIFRPSRICPKVNLATSRAARRPRRQHRQRAGAHGPAAAPAPPPTTAVAGGPLQNPLFAGNLELRDVALSMRPPYSRGRCAFAGNRADPKSAGYRLIRARPDPRRDSRWNFWAGHRSGGPKIPNRRRNRGGMDRSVAIPCAPWIRH